MSLLSRSLFTYRSGPGSRDLNSIVVRRARACAHAVCDMGWELPSSSVFLFLGRWPHLLLYVAQVAHPSVLRRVKCCDFSGYARTNCKNKTQESRQSGTASIAGEQERVTCRRVAALSTSNSIFFCAPCPEHVQFFFSRPPLLPDWAGPRR